MHIHLPKPLHGWREFVGEVGIIVIGVLIALVAEQVVEDWNWQQKVSAERNSLMVELGNDRARWEFDMQQSRCGVQQLDGLIAWARNGAAGKEPPHGAISSNFFLMHSASWTLASGNQTLEHFPLDEQLAFANLYDGISHRQKDITDAIDLMDKIESETDLASDPDDRHELLKMYGSLRGKFKELLGNEAYMRRHFDAIRVRPDRSDFVADLHNQSCA